MPSDPQIRGIPTSPRVEIFRAIDSVIRADTWVREVFKTNIRSWQGRSDDKNPPSSGQYPFLRLTPHAGDENWWSTDAQKGLLTIDFEIHVQSYCYDDIDNAWFVVQRALQPLDRVLRANIVNRLQALKAMKGLCEFNMPAYDPDGGGDGIYAAHAQLRIEYWIQVQS